MNDGVSSTSTTPSRATVDEGNDDGARVAQAFPVVALGASAGGLDAFRKFFNALPADSGMAFVVVQHLSPDQESDLSGILRGFSSMPVHEITGPTPLAPGAVYVMPANSAMTVDKGVLHLEEPSRERRFLVSIDRFFESLAYDRGEDAAGIVLSGTGSDGARGIQAIRERGGVTLVQAPAEAEHSSMPEHAIATGRVDLVLPAADLALRLVSLFRTRTAALEPESATLERNREAFEAAYMGIMAHLRMATGHDFSRYKRPTMMRRIDRRLTLLDVPDWPGYLVYLQSHPAEVRVLFSDLLIKVTEFFRDKEPFAALLEQVITPLVEDRERAGPVRVWVAGCATGQEAYSIGMLIIEAARRLGVRPDFTIFATDLDERAIDAARRGTYSEAACADLSPERLARFFVKEAGGYRVTAALREHIVFAVHNLLKDPPFARLDLVSCRNLLIYLSGQAQRTVFDVFHYALRDGEALFLGASESASGAADIFSVSDKSQRIYRARSAPRRLPQPMAITTGPGRTMVHVDRAGGSDHGRICLDAFHHDLLVRHYAPPSVIVDKDYRILHVAGPPNPLLYVPDGVPTTALLKMILPELRIKLRVALAAAFQGSENRVRAFVTLGDERVMTPVQLYVRPIHMGHNVEEMVQVIFESVVEDRLVPIPPVPAGTREDLETEMSMSSVVAALEDELQQVREELHQTLRQHGLDAEELKTSNEELLTINEELQSTTEEMETSKEELQSTNEELLTVNQELSHKLAELGEVNSDLKNLLSSTDIGTIFLHTNLCIRRFTLPVKSYFNLVDADVGRRFDHITHGLDYPLLGVDVRGVLESLQPVEREVGSAGGRWYIVRILPYRDQKSQIDGVVLTFFDTTERKHREKALLIDKVEADRIAERRAFFIAELSHEIRTPLTSIIGVSHLLSQKPRAEQERRLIRMIETSGRRLNQIVDWVLDLTRVESGSLTPQYVEVDLVAELEEGISLLEPIAELRDVTLQLNCAPEFMMVRTDVGFFRRIVNNLVENAIKYTDEGEVTVTLGRLDGVVQLTVSDTGVGISDEFLPQIFATFAQEAAIGRTFSGSGLGLALVKELVELLDGTITVASQVGQGTTFTVVVPEPR